MERHKRVYPAKRNHNRWLSSALLLASVLIVLSGLISRGASGDFSLEKLPEVTPIPLDETFDETMTSAAVELPANTWYALQVGVFENEESAQQSALAFQKRGAAGYLWPDGRYRVLAAVYPLRDDAQAVRDQLKDQHSIDSYLYAIELPAISLRLTGMQGQLEILQAAFGHANELAVQLQSLSVAMDRQEVSVIEALEQLNGLRTQMNLVALRLTQRFPEPIHQTVQALIECFDDYSQFSSALSADESSVTLGMKLKYQTFATLRKIQNVYQTLSQT